MVRCAAFTLLLVAGAPLAGPLPALARLPRLPATLAVDLVDDTTGEPLVGATVVLGQSVAITDEHGSASLAGEVGVARLAIYYADATVDRYVALARSSMKHTLAIPHVDVSAPPDPCPPIGTEATPKQIASIAAAVVAHAPQIADGHFLTTPVVLASLPGVVGAPGAEVMDEAEIQRSADRTGKRQNYLSIDQIEVGAGCAKVEARISIAQPRAHTQDVLCCCTSYDVYRRRRDGSWAFSQNLGATCG